MDDKTPLAYERPAQSIPRWQFRLLFALVLLNLAITIQTSYAPGVAAAVKQKWAEYLEARRVNVLRQQALNWGEAPGKVVWDDDPETAKGLLAGSGYAPVGIPYNIEHNYPFLVGWPGGAAAKPPSFTSQLFRRFPDSADRPVQGDEHYAVVFMHRLRTPKGEERLVYVCLIGSTDLNMARIPHPTGNTAWPAIPSFEAYANRSLRLIAVPCLPGDGPALPKTLAKESSGLTIAPHAAGSPWNVAWKWVPSPDGQTGRVVVDPRDQFRFYAGQADPADPAHFTIDFDRDGVRGVIHGRLKDDGTVDLKSDTGTITGEHWHLGGK